MPAASQWRGVLDERRRRRVGEQPDAGAERRLACTHFGKRRQRVRCGDLGRQAPAVRHAVDVAVVGDDVVEVEDVEIVETDVSQRFDVPLADGDRLLRQSRRVRAGSCRDDRLPVRTCAASFVTASIVASVDAERRQLHPQTRRAVWRAVQRRCDVRGELALRRRQATTDIPRPTRYSRSRSITISG